MSVQEEPVKQAPESSGATGAAFGCKVGVFRQLLEKLPAAAYLCDPNGMITYYNQRAVKLWGCEPRQNEPVESFCGSFRLYTPDGTRIGRDQCWMVMALQTNQEYSDQEVIVERPDGKRLTVLANATPVWDESGALLGALNVLMDITDRKEAEEGQRQLRAALARLSRLSVAGEMAAGLAHELNQPLTAIINYSEACVNLLRTGRASTGELVAAIESIAEQGQRAGAIIRRLRGFIRQTPIQQLPVNLDALIREAIGYVAAEAQQEKVGLRVEVMESPLEVEVDPIQIQQVLVNLMRNSIEAMADAESSRRSITIQTARTADEAVTVTLCDTGPGLTEEVCEQLFYPFVTTKPQGMGLGLSISKSIVEAHGGRLWTTHSDEAGAVFHFTVPCAGIQQHPVADLPEQECADRPASASADIASGPG